MTIPPSVLFGACKALTFAHACLACGFIAVLIKDPTITSAGLIVLGLEVATVFVLYVVGWILPTIVDDEEVADG